jgi:hypothetical protein
MTTTDDDLSVATEEVCFIIGKARVFDVKDVVTDPDSGSTCEDFES